MVRAFYSPSSAIPILMVGSEITVKVCLEKLAKAEALEASRGILHPHEVTASKFLGVGIDLQEQQYVHPDSVILASNTSLTVFACRRALHTKRGKTDDKKLTLQTQRNTLAHRIKSWHLIQAFYMPMVATLIAQEAEGPVAPGDTIPKPEEERLWLPSDVPREKWATGLSAGLAEKEMQLRKAEADDALYQFSVHVPLRSVCH